MTRINKINKKDLNRVLLTETLPYETPITFCPDYLYSKVSSPSQDVVHAFIVKHLITAERRATVPYRYQIRKTEDSLRRLALLHPNSQWEVRRFYERYESLILHYTSKSEVSIRAPQKIAGSFYTKKSWENIYKYKDGGVGIAEVGDFAKHAPSYFTYRGYDRLWKFYSSNDYLNLERKFSHLVNLDVSKCFDSIYTHCLSWATKDKQFVKDHLRTFTFGDYFDKIIRHGNHDETNGIPIGPEVSRIFAEIILQRIDSDTINRLAPQYTLHRQYTIRRYVDDIFIYADSETTASAVRIAYTESLLAYNLHVNPLKAQLYTRPFTTKKSTLVSLALERTEQLCEKIFEARGDKIGISVVHEPNILLKDYISSIKTICHQVDSTYYDVSSWLISVFVERVKKVCEGVVDGDVNDHDRLQCLKLVLDICFFLYGVAPSVNASYKLSAAIILLTRYFRDNNYSTREQMYNHIFNSVQRMLMDSNTPRSTLIREFVDLEVMNIVLASHELGSEFRLSPEMVRISFLNNSEKNYFSLSSCLFYIGGEARYSDVQLEVIGSINEKLADCREIASSSEIAHIFLDAISCPHISTAQRDKWIRAFLTASGSGTSGASISASDISNFVNGMGDEWTAPWLKVDLLNSLEKRELKRAY